MRLVYVAGPYRGISPEDVDLNIASAVQVGKLVARAGFFPVIPHNCTRHFDRFGGLSDDFYLAGTLELLRRCDALILCPGWESSSGTLLEVEEAHRQGLRVARDVAELKSYY